MARRALRKVKSTLDLSRHLKSFDELPCPWDAEALFHRRAPLEVEVGSGKGLFLITASQARPDVDFLGVEVAESYARFSAARLAKRGTSNACLLHADAGRVFAQVLPQDSLAAVHVYFPDPWWKSRHKKRRIMNESFLRGVQRTLSPGGLLHFWTDVEEYFHNSVQLVSECTSLFGPRPVPEQPAEHEFDFRTNFERRVRLSGKPVFRAEFEKAL